MGGGIKWSNEFPYISEENFFIGNLAQYSGEIASFAIRIKLNVYNKTQFSKEESNKSLLFSSFDNQSISLYNISSGNEIPYVLEIEILDFYENIVKLDNA